MPLDPWQRLQADDHLISLVATAIRLRHPQSVRMAELSVSKLAGLTDEQIQAATDRLTRWIDAQSTVAGAVNAAVLLTGGPSLTAKDDG